MMDFPRVLVDAERKCSLVVEWYPPSANVTLAFHFPHLGKEVTCKGDVGACLRSLTRGTRLALRSAVGRGAAQDLVAELSLVLHEIQRRLTAAKG